MNRGPPSVFVSCGHNEGCVYIDDEASGQNMHVVALPSKYLYRVAIHPDNRYAAVAGRVLFVVDVLEGLHVPTPVDMELEGVIAVAFAPNGRTLVCASRLG
jgi:hypothetical protein